MAVEQKEMVGTLRQKVNKVFSLYNNLKLENEKLHQQQKELKENLKIKETDRLEALKTELTKLGAKVSVTNDSLTLENSISINENIVIATYQDHRMAMAFAPLALKVPIQINEAEVVSKSYPDFWEDLRKAGFTIEEI